jgi:hypothetical protein
MKKNQFSRLLAFLERLDQSKTSYTMEHSRDDAVMVTILVPGEYWEVEFLEDGSMEIERYRSDGSIHDESVLEELFALCSDEAAPPPEVAGHGASRARK